MFKSSKSFWQDFPLLWWRFPTEATSTAFRCRIPSAETQKCWEHQRSHLGLWSIFWGEGFQICRWNWYFEFRGPDKENGKDSTVTGKTKVWKMKCRMVWCYSDRLVIPQNLELIWEKEKPSLSSQVRSFVTVVIQDFFVKALKVLSGATMICPSSPISRTS